MEIKKSMSNPILKIQSKEFTTELKHSLTEMFQSLTNEILDTIDNLNEDKSEYIVRIYPFSLERIDKKPIPKRVLKAIKDRLCIEKKFN